MSGKCEENSKNVFPGIAVPCERAKGPFKEVFSEFLSFKFNGH